MLTLLAYVHILIGIGLVLFVLLQDPKGGAMGVFSGGSSSNTFFGSSGATNFLTTTTRWLAILFAFSCLTLTYMTAKRGTSVMDNYTAPAATVPADGSAPPTNPSSPSDAAAQQAAPATPEKGAPAPDTPKK